MSILDVVKEIERARHNSGLDIAELCKQAGISRATYYHWLEHRTNASINLLSLVMDVLNLEITVTGRKA